MSEEIRNEEMIESEQPKEPPRFETRTTYTKELMREFKLWGMRFLRKPVLIWGIIVVFAVIAAAEYMRHGVTYVFLIYIVYDVIGVVYIIFRPYILANRSVNLEYRRLMFLKQEIPTMEATFYDSEIITAGKEPGSQKAFSYADARKLHRTKHLYVIMLPEKMCIIIDQNGFVTGDAEAFEAFLAEKCPQAKRNFLKGRK